VKLLIPNQVFQIRD